MYVCLYNHSRMREWEREFLHHLFTRRIKKPCSHWLRCFVVRSTRISNAHTRNKTINDGFVLRREVYYIKTFYIKTTTPHYCYHLKNFCQLFSYILDGRWEVKINQQLDLCSQLHVNHNTLVAKFSLFQYLSYEA